jgi:4-hydroxythreonine-4-phosphate dehydrogenase
MVVLEKEYVVVPMGDPAGIGPEIVVKSFAKDSIFDDAKVIVVGDAKILEQANEICRTNLKINSVSALEDGKYTNGTLDVYDLDLIDIDEFEFGEVQSQCGEASYKYIEKAADLCINGEAAAMATTTINKESLAAADINELGHTSILAKLTGVKDPLTMFQVKDLRVTFYSKHVSLKEACDLISKEGIKNYVRRTIDSLDTLGVQNPKVAVAGLNPHSGEHGLFGTEEVDSIIPAIEELKNEGVDVHGPIGADSVFYQALNGKYDGVLSLYHDQGHIATKMVDFHRTISITHDLPFLRTSVDHGTAFDIAGQGIASEVSLDEAIKLAAKYASAFKEKYEG